MKKTLNLKNILLAFVLVSHHLNMRWSQLSSRKMITCWDYCVSISSPIPNLFPLKILIHSPTRPHQGNSNRIRISRNESMFWVVFNFQLLNCNIGTIRRILFGFRNQHHILRTDSNSRDILSHVDCR